MKTKQVLLSLSLLSFYLSGCNTNNLISDSTSSSSEKESSINESSSSTIKDSSQSNIDESSSSSIISEEEISSLPQVDNFKIESDVENGFSYDASTNTYTITLAGEYNLYNDLVQGQVIVNASDDSKVILNLNGVNITNNNEAPLYIKNASSVDISAKKDTINYIYDLRDYSSYTDEAIGGAIYSSCDLTLKGKGELNVTSTFNNGIHSKDDLDIKNLTLKVKATNNSLKGNDEIKIESGDILAISTSGDGLKTSTTSLSKKGKQKGNINIEGGTLSVYSMCDAIDSACNVNISNDSVINLYTDSYSTYSDDSTSTQKEKLYIRVNENLYNNNYKYSAYFYNTDGTYKWVYATFYKKIENSNNDRPGGFGGGRPGGRFNQTYYYYELVKPSDYSNVMFYAYNTNMNQSQSDEYVFKSKDGVTLSDYFDTYCIESVSSSLINSSSWSNLKTSSNKEVSYSCKGIKAANEITIDNGTITIKATDDGIHANFDEVLESTNANGLGNITINGGDITITTKDDGIHADQDVIINGGAINLLTSYEGIEGNRIYFNGGNSKIYSTDDAINASSKGAYSAYIEINDGYIDATVSNGDTDTIDSNGTIKITGGLVFLKNGQTSGQSMTGGTFDCDGSITVTSGTIIAIGCVGEKLSNAYTNTQTTLQAGSYTIKDSNNNEIATFTLTQSYRGFMFYDESFNGNTTYILYKDETKFLTFSK